MKKTLEEIRKFFWNYKYSENYDPEVYQMVVDLISYVDKNQEKR